jgi:hypothetical protein
MTLARLALGPLVLVFAAAASAQEAERPPITLFFADGSSQPLRAWSFSYEYATWRKGDTPARGTTTRRDTTDLLVGKRVVPTAGGTVEVAYAGVRAKDVTVVDPAGKRTVLKVEAPLPEAVAPELGKDMVVQVRGLDLAGETLTGGKRTYCLLSYTALVECDAEPAQRVVKIQFP